MTQSSPRPRAVSVLVIEDDFGNPIGLFMQVAPEHVIAEIADNEQRFNEMLRQLGIDKTLVIDTVKPPPPLPVR